MSGHLAEIQRLDPGAIIALFSIDCSPIGGTILRFVKGSESNGPVFYQGLEYTPIDIQFEGLETSGQGSLPTPTISIANSDFAQGGIIQATVNSFGDLNGCIVTRIRVSERFLDGRPDADADAYFGPDIYAVEQKTSDTPEEITWELSAAIDQAGRMIPGRAAVRDTCIWRYRVWDAGVGAFNYDKAQCPYTGGNLFDELDQPVFNQSEDKPSRSTKCCKLRFGADQALPFGGFPGMGRVR